MQVSIIITILIFLIAVIIFLSVDKKLEEKKIRKIIRNKYGQRTKNFTELNKDISIFWEEINDLIPEDETIDKTTWNDLNMDEIFSCLNDTYSFVGEQVLYKELHYSSKSKERLRNLEELINYFENNVKEREDMQFSLWKLGKEKVNYYLPIFLINLEIHKIPYIIFLKTLSISLITTIILALISKSIVCIMIASIIFLINIIIYTLRKSSYEIYLDTLGGIIRIAKLSKIIISKGDLMPNISNEIKQYAKTFEKLSYMIASMQKKKQATISGDTLQLIGDYLIGATMWDFIQYDKIVRYLDGKQKEFLELYQFIGKIDMAISIASFRRSVKDYCLPEFSDKKELNIKELYHPLIEHPVVNTIELKSNCFITGSNASGKSTFIKSIIVNIILAQSINTCLAKKMLIPDARVITSMAIRDDVISGESYYIKEIKNIKRIIDNCCASRYIICAIDEILSGTNTKERIAASSALLNYLSTKNCLVIVASHDLELAESFSDIFDMYFFSERINEKDIVFDYKLKPGISNTKNAINLLEYLEFPNEIIQEAKVNFALIKSDCHGIILN